jgi:hypothetical protein
MTRRTRESQYQTCVDEAETVGVERLGMQQSWREDPATWSSTQPL